MKSEYKLSFDTGLECFIIAETRREAIEAYCRKSGMSEEWLKAHCKIKRLGRVE